MFSRDEAVKAMYPDGWFNRTGYRARYYSRSKEQVRRLKTGARLKRDRRRERNRLWVAAGGEHPSVWKDRKRG